MKTIELPALTDKQSAIMSDWKATMAQLDELLYVHYRHGWEVLDSSIWFQSMRQDLQRNHMKSWRRKALWKEPDYGVAGSLLTQKGVEVLDGPFWCSLCCGYDDNDPLQWVISECNPDYLSAHAVGPFAYADSARLICDDFNKRKQGFHLYRNTPCAI